MANMPVTREQLAKIHIAKKELALDDDSYRTLLAARFQAQSAKELNFQQAGILLDHFRRSGWQPKPRTRQVAADNGFIRSPFPQHRMIAGMWHELGYALPGLHARVKKQFGIDRLEWLKDEHALHVLITDLEARLKRRGLR